jgi:uncharacterized membrane protein YoaT (DUF817 family)
MGTVEMYIFIKELVSTFSGCGWMKENHVVGSKISDLNMRSMWFIIIIINIVIIIINIISGEDW